MDPTSGTDIALVKNRAAPLLERLEQALAAGQIGEEQWYREVAAVITPSYLAGNNPRSQSGSNSDDASWQLNRGLIADAIHKDGTFTLNVATKWSRSTPEIPARLPRTAMPESASPCTMRC